MSEITKDTNRRLRKLNLLLTSLKKVERFEVMRLTMVKKLCNDLGDARAFAVHLASWARDKYISENKNDYLEQIEKAMNQLKRSVKSPSSTNLTKLRSIHSDLKKDSQKLEIFLSG